MNLGEGGEGVKNPENFADFICTWPLMKDPIPHLLTRSLTDRNRKNQGVVRHEEESRATSESRR